MSDIRSGRRRHSQLVHCREVETNVQRVELAPQTTKRRLLCLLFRFEGVGFGRFTQPRAWPAASVAARCSPAASRRDAPRCRVPLENCRASTSILFFNFQATKSQRWMPWRQEPMKDVGDCEKLWGAVDQASIHRCPNGETLHSSWSATPV